MYPSEWFDAVFSYPAAEEDFWRNEARDVDDPIVMFPCGTGDLVIALAEDGHKVVALDQDHQMLGRTLAKLRSEPIEVRELVQMGLADLTFYTGRDPQTDAIFVPRNGWWCLPDEGARKRALVALARRLEPEGTLIIDVFNVTVEERTSGRGWSKMPRASETFLGEPFNCWRKINASVRQEGERHIEEFTVCAYDGTNVQPLDTVSLVCPTHEQMKCEIEESDEFEIDGLFGGWRREEFVPNDSSGRQIWVLRKK